MKRELLYYQFLSVVFNLLPKGRIKDKLGEYATGRFPVVENSQAGHRL